MNNKNRTYAIGAGALVVLLFVVVWGVRKLNSDHMGPPPPSVVETVRAETRDVAVQISALGTLDGDQSIVISPEINGIVTSIDFVDGQRLEQGDTIISIDSGSLKARLMQTQARVTLSRANFDRAKRLRKQGSGTERALDEALNDMRSAEADMAAAQADLDKANIAAPFTGIIGLRRVSLGQYLKAGDTIATLADIDHLRIDFRVSEVFLTEINKGQAVSVQFDALPGETFTGTIRAMDPVIDVSGRAISVRAELINEGGKLRPGIFGRVTIVTKTRRSIVLPESALVPQKTGEKAVFVVVDTKPEGTENMHGGGNHQGGEMPPMDPNAKFADLRTVEIGERMTGEVEIISGLKEGEIVVTAGQLKIRPGDAILPRGDAVADAPVSEQEG